MYPARPSRLLALAASAVLALTLSSGPALAAPCHGCEDPELPENPGGPADCGIAPTTEPTITTASPRVGATASGTAGQWAGSPTHLTYRWLIGGQVMPDATSLTSPVLPASAYGKPLVLRVMATKQDCQTGVDYSLAKTVGIGAAPVTTVTPTLSTQQPRVDVPITVTAGSWSPAAESYRYQWYLDNAAIEGATSMSYVPSASTAGHALKVRVTAVKAGHSDGTSTRIASAPIAKGDASVSTVLPSFGRAEVGVPVAVDSGTWTRTPDSLSYQWRLDNVDVAGATGSSFIPPADSAGQSLTVVVKAHQAGYEDGQAISPTRVVHPASPLAFTSTPTISGKAMFGRTLKARPGKISGHPAKVKYQWRRDGKAIAGATEQTYETARADIGHRLSVRIVATKLGTARLVRTVQAGTVAPAWMTWKGETLTISGSPTVGAVLKSGLTRDELLAGTNPDAAKVSYRWLRNGKTITGAKAETYRVTTADRGARVTLRVALTKPGHKTVVVRASKRIR